MSRAIEARSAIGRLRETHRHALDDVRTAVSTLEIFATNIIERPVPRYPIDAASFDISLGNPWVSSLYNLL